MDGLESAMSLALDRSRLMLCSLRQSRILLRHVGSTGSPGQVVGECRLTRSGSAGGYWCAATFTTDFEVLWKVGLVLILKSR